MAKVLKPAKATTTGWTNYPTLAFGAPPKAAAKVAAPADPYAGLYKVALAGVQSPAQITATANAQALAREREMLAAQKAVSDQTIAAYNNQQTRAEGFAKALGTLQAGEDQQAQTRYQTAAGALTGIGTGLTGDVSDRYQSAVDQTKAEIARLTGGLGVVNAPAADDIRNAAQYAGVTIPARTLTEGAVNAARLAQSDAAARRDNIHQIGVGYGAKADDAIAQAASDARALIAKRPATIAELVNQLTANRQTGVSNLGNILAARTGYRQTEQKRLDDLSQQKIANKLAIDKFNSDNAHWVSEDARATRQVDLTERALDNTMRQTGASILGVDPVTGMPTLSTVQANRQWQAQLASIASTTSAQNGYRMVWRDGKLTPQLDAKGNVVPLLGAKLAPGGQSVIKVPTKTATGKGKLVGYGGLSPSGLRTLKGKVEDRVIKGLETDSDVKTFVGVGKEGADDQGYVHSQSAATDYTTALRSALQAGPNTPAWRKAATEIVQNHYPAGHNGRPPFQLKRTRTSDRALYQVAVDAMNANPDKGWQEIAQLLSDPGGVQLHPSDPNFYLPANAEQIKQAAYRAFYASPAG